MSLEAALRHPNGADSYERTAVFDRYARDLVERARPIGASDRILDLGCGTGIVARVLRERLGGAAHIVGLDVSPPMIEEARSIAPEIDFRLGDAMGLPFADGSFDLVLCQHMLQFVPDPLAALREVRRVLTPGGRLLATTWRPRSELDGPALGHALAEAGFTEVRIETVSMTVALEDGFGATSVANVASATTPRTT